MTGFFENALRIGQKKLGLAKTIGLKGLASVSGGLRVGSKVVNKGQKATGMVASVLDRVAGLGSAIKPFARFVGKGDEVQKGIDLANKLKGTTRNIGSVMGDVGSSIGSARSIVREGRAILQDPATTMKNLRSMSKDVGAGAKSLDKTFEDAKKLGTGLKGLF